MRSAWAAEVATSVLALYWVDCAKSLQIDRPPFHHCILGFSPRCILGAFSPFLFPLFDEWPSPTTRGVFIWWPVRLVINYPSYQLSHLGTICQSCQLWRNRPNHALASLTHTHTPTIFPLLSDPHDLSLTLGFPWINPLSAPKLFWIYFICCWEKFVFLVWN